MDTVPILNIIYKKFARNKITKILYEAVDGENNIEKIHVVF
jgi:hypothetical protein